MKRLLVVWVALMSLAGSAAACWTEENRWGMLTDARRLMPENLQWVLTRFDGELQEGYHRAGRPERPDDVAAVMADSEAAIKSFSVDSSYSAGARMMGRIARRISEMHSLLTGTSPLNDRNWVTDYAIFLQKNRPYLRIRWRGVDHRPRTDDALQDLLTRSVLKKDKMSAILVETLNRENKSISSYDLQSAPFGAGTIAYSGAVNSIAMTWLYIWDKAGGIRQVSSNPPAP